MSAGAAITAAVPSLAETSLGAVLREALPSSDAAESVRMIRLSRNENAYGPSANVIATMREAALHAANRYPEADAEALRNKIASLHAVTPEQVVLGCGSGEILRMAAEAFAGSHADPSDDESLIVDLESSSIRQSRNHYSVELVSKPRTQWVDWLRRRLESGRVEACDTFGSRGR